MQASNEEPVNSTDSESSSDNDDDTEHYEEAKIEELRPDKKEKIAEGVFEWTFSIYPLQKTKYAQQEEKIIMVIGATGKGKSTLINRMINHILGVKYIDPSRYQLVIEEKSHKHKVKQETSLSIHLKF